MALNPRSWLKAAESIERLLTLDEKHRALIEAQAQEIRDLKSRVARLESREEVVIAEAKAAAAAAASTAASQHIAELALHLGALDERTRNLGRLPKPEGDHD